jgi:hypothetical protein
MPEITENTKLKWWHYILLAVAVVISYIIACILFILLTIPIAIDEVIQKLRKIKGSKLNAK